jgi:hypothetical protein
MTHIPYKEPQFEETSFNCPFCNAFSRQLWYGVTYFNGSHQTSVDSTQVCFCSHCGMFSLWLGDMMIYPNYSGIEPPNQDLDKGIQDDYMEAAGILQKSPRGAAALLRLAIQKLCTQLGETGKDINEDIKNLVVKGLPVKVQQSLDAVRVIGNEAVHPGQLDLKDDSKTAASLFKLLNFIAEKMITEPKEIDAIYAKIPDSKKEGIEKRDGKK